LLRLIVEAETPARADALLQEGLALAQSAGQIRGAAR
jgi:hypothetical protein